MTKALKVAVAGVGGFAGSHHESLARLEVEGECQVVATCDPSPERLGVASDRFGFAGRGVRMYPDLSQLLEAERPDVVTLPTPIPLHAPQHAMAVESGACCYLEKPPSLWWPEFRSMLEIEGAALRETQVGFNFTGDPFRREIKQRALSGEFGRLLGVSLYAHWPRDAVYYARNDWGGRLRVKDRWVLDSPIGNALAHYVHNLLFWAGESGVDGIADIERVEAWLGRAHPIQTYDTAVARAELRNGVWLRIGATHTGTAPHEERETLVFEGGRIDVQPWRVATIRRGGLEERIESGFQDQADLLRSNLGDYLSYVRGERDRPTTRLRDAEPFVSLCDLALISAGQIEPFVPARVQESEGRMEVEGLREELLRFVEGGEWQGFGKPVGVGDLDRLESVAHRLVG